MATVEEIKVVAKKIRNSSTRYGCYFLDPPVALRCKVAIDADAGEFGVIGKVGDIVHASAVDENGKYPDTVHLVEKGFWWPVHFFDICES